MAQRIKTDWVLFGAVIFLVAFGLVMVFSASAVVAHQKYGSGTYYLARQLGWAFVSVLLMMYLKWKDYRLLRSPVWVFSLVSVVLALVIATYFYDGRRIRIGSISIQPSEFAKPVLILFLAWFVTRRAPAINHRNTLLPAAILVGPLAGAVMYADLGTAIVLVIAAAVVFFVGGLERRFLIAGGILVGLGILGAVFSKPYRIVRIFGLIDPEYKILRHFDRDGKLMAYMQRSAAHRDPDYHVRQSLIAVGSGGPLGLGPSHGKQKLYYLPEAHTDFIYAVVGEELGLWGSLLVLSAFLIILWRGLRLYFLAPDDFGKYLALGVTTVVVAQAFINMSVVLGMGPAKGIPLPMVSYGGSSLLSMLASLGILQSIGDHSG
jgi:cell division protein FtsW